MVKRGRGRPKMKKNISSACGDESAEFFKVFLPHLTSQQLMIPPDFIKYFKRTIKERVVLKNTGGKTWHVDVEETRKGFFLKNGWQSFVYYHRLKVGDFLVFRYDGCYSFVVKIYGTNGCKKETSAAENIATTRVKIEQKTEEEFGAGKTFCKRACLHKEDSLLRSNERTGQHSRENCNELENAERALPRGPYFVSSASQSILHKLEIPNQVIDRYDLHLKPEMVLCNSNGNEWPVKIYIVKDEIGCMYMGKGWSAFQKENKVGSKDSYVFTFGTTRSSTTIHVQVVRATPPDVLQDA